MKKVVLTVLLFVFVQQFFGQDLKEYFYEIGKKREVKVYKFFDRNTSSHFYRKIVIRPGSKSVKIVNHDKYYIDNVVTKETLREDGIYLTSAKVYIECLLTPICDGILYGADSSRKTADVIERDSYIWDENRTETSTIQYQYGSFIKLSRTRSYVSHEIIEIMGRSYDAVKFLDRHTLEYLREPKDKVSYEQFVYMAKGLGEVKFEGVKSQDENENQQLRDSLRVFSRYLKYTGVWTYDSFEDEGFMDAELVDIITNKELRELRKNGKPVFYYNDKKTHKEPTWRDLYPRREKSTE